MQPTASSTTPTAAPARTTTPTDRREVVVRVEGLTRLYENGGEQIRPVDNLALKVHAGEFVALMGPSGSGKSTLLNLLIGIDRPTSGTVYVAGQDLSALGRSKMARWRNRHLGVIFQQYHLIPVLNAAENVELPLRLRRDIPARERRERVAIALEAVDLTDRATHLPRQLSGGQQQRVAIARAFVTNPDLMVADEPTGNLDRGSVGATLELLRRLHREFKMTLVMVTHDPQAASIADRTLFLEDGQLTPTPRHPQAIALARAVSASSGANPYATGTATAPGKRGAS